MRVDVPVEPVISDGGMEYMTAEKAVLTQLAEWHCYPRELAHWAFEDWVGNPRYKESYYAFKRNDNPPEAGTISVFIPDEHPAALMAKLKWGGSGI